MTSISDWLAANKDLERLECELLIGSLLGFSRAQILIRGDHVIAPTHLLQLEQWQTQLRAGIPLAYLLEEREFWGLNLRVTPAVLIPRPETELLVELVLQLAPPNARVLDLGTGSGAIAIALAHERPDLIITAVDNAKDALQIAEQNGRQHKVKVTFTHSHWLDAFAADQYWDIVVANPPYIAPDDPHLPSLKAEPMHALVADQQGLADLGHIAAQAIHHLSSGGYLLMEHGYDQADKVRRIMTDAGFTQIRCECDLAQIERATLGCKPNSAE